VGEGMGIDSKGVGIDSVGEGMGVGIGCLSIERCG
jgi:hypothetical protein